MEYFFVETVLSRLYDARTGEIHRTIEILGTSENVVIAEYVYYFLVDRLEALWKEHRRRNGVRGAGKRSYRLGVLEGFKAKLHKSGDDSGRGENRIEPERKTVHDLVCSSDRRLAEFLKARFPRLSSGRFGPSTVDRGQFMAGIEDGRRLTLNKGMTQQDGYLGKLLSSGTDYV